MSKFLKFKVVDKGTILEVYDDHKVYIGNANREINLWTLTIEGEMLDKSYTFDIVDYIRNKSINGEILRLTSSKLGFNVNQVLPDGVYKYTSTINGLIVESSYVLSIIEIDEGIKFIMSSIDKITNPVNVDYVTTVISSEVFITTLNKTKLLREQLYYLAANDSFNGVSTTLKAINNNLKLLKQLINKCK